MLPLADVDFELNCRPRKYKALFKHTFMYGMYHEYFLTYFIGFNTLVLMVHLCPSDTTIIHVCCELLQSYNALFKNSANQAKIAFLSAQEDRVKTHRLPASHYDN